MPVLGRRRGYFARAWSDPVLGVESLLKQLNKERVKFIIIGGYAAMAHGAATVTQDIDICCEFKVANLLQLAKALRGLHAVHRMTPQKLPLELTRANAATFKNLYLRTDLGQLDCLSEVLGVGAFATVRKRSVEVDTPWGNCRVMELDALIEAKLAMGRPKDVATAKELAAIRDQRRQSTD